jgi:rhodanese-related sulfurtransferase
LNSFVTVSQLPKGASPQTLLVDLRSGSEFAGGHIPGAVNIAMGARSRRVWATSAPIFLFSSSAIQAKRARMTADLLESTCGEREMEAHGTQR